MGRPHFTGRAMAQAELYHGQTPCHEQMRGTVSHSPAGRWHRETPLHGQSHSTGRPHSPQLTRALRLAPLKNPDFIPVPAAGPKLNKELGLGGGHTLPAVPPPHNPGVCVVPGWGHPLLRGPINHLPALQNRPLVPLHVVEEGAEEPRDHQHLWGKRSCRRHRGHPGGRVGSKEVALPGPALTFSPIRLRWSCSGSAAQRRKVQMSLAICDMVAGVPGQGGTQGHLG